MTSKECVRIKVSKDCCYLQFSDKKPIRELWYGGPLEDETTTHRSEKIGKTIRGEEIIADYDEKDNILGLELLGSRKAKKPCQR
jgi:uncharacterized protein YuzE